MIHFKILYAIANGITLRFMKIEENNSKYAVAGFDL